VDFEDALISIAGENFGTRCPPVVLLGYDTTPLALLSNTEDRIEVGLPEVPDGDYLLQVEFPERCGTRYAARPGYADQENRRRSELRSRTYDLTIGAIGPPGPEGPRGPQGPECAEDPAVLNALCDLYEQNGTELPAICPSSPLDPGEPILRPPSLNESQLEELLREVRSKLGEDQKKISEEEITKNREKQDKKVGEKKEIGEIGGL